MDTITHGIVGALAGKALFAGRDVPAGYLKGGESRALSSPTARAAIVACTLGSMFPDIDIFAGPLAHNPLAIMEWHRSITHSALLLPIWALLLATASIPIAGRLKWKSPPFPALFGIYAVGIATHIFLDLITSFGTMVWSPLRYSRPAWDWVFILDLTLTAIALVPQFAAWCYRDPEKFRLRAICVWAALTAGAFGTYLFASSQGYGFPVAVVGVASAIFALIVFLPAAQGAGFQWTRARWCRAGLVVLCVYIGLTAAAHHKAFADVEKFAAAQHLQVETLAALPLPPTMTHWVGLVGTAEGVWRTTFHEPGGAVESTQFYANAQASEFIEQARNLRDVQVFLWFARYPVWRVRQREGQQTVLEISDVRFFRENVPEAMAASQPSTGAAGIRPRPAGFTFDVVFDSGGHIISHGFREPE
jgi:membrane-bound metal-dependent hydrolase YbcI (DUF457 family)